MKSIGLKINVVKVMYEVLTKGKTTFLVNELNKAKEEH